ncbi:hypothetical protein D6D10_00813 [Aureobasidium pullulans]|uniref:Zn(2)-C6 fungal-type domain-containing protein n=1 Tax=Aureobasidium pullulans TaxID=5580 RepID=A0A4V4J9H3_AURPU|nr:hypothetical protein D6D10_00813 [Aureobasidium pullulans]
MSNNTRKKSCRECSKAKRRCNLSNPCKRCIDRSLACIYTNAPSRVTPFPRGNVRQDPSAEPVHNRQISPNAATQTWEKILTISSDTPGSITLDESNDEAAAYTAFLPDLPETQVINTETNKLCIENIMISGSDYRRADYHKVTSIWASYAPIFLTTVQDKFTHETLADPNSRLNNQIKDIKSYHSEFASLCQTPWLHRRLYKSGMPDIMFSAYRDCVMYSQKTEHNKGLVYRSLEESIDTLLSLEAMTNGGELLVRVQCLLLYQSMQLFDQDVRQQCLAGSRMKTLELWTDVLGDLRDASPELSNKTVQQVPVWESWIYAESLRRTVIASYTLITLHYMLKQDIPSQGGWTRSQPWSICQQVWSTQSSFDFLSVWDQDPPVTVSCLLLDEFLEQDKADAVDDFARNMLVTYIGLDETKQWFKQRGSTY